MAEGGDGKLTNWQYVHLAYAISIQAMESIALGYLGIELEVIDSLKEEHKNNTEKFKRELLRIWAYKNSGSDQVKVARLICYVFSLCHKRITKQRICSCKRVFLFLQKLARLLYRFSIDCGYLNTDKVH